MLTEVKLGLELDLHPSMLSREGDRAMFPALSHFSYFLQLAYKKDNKRETDEG